MQINFTGKRNPLIPSITQPGPPLDNFDPLDVIYKKGYALLCLNSLLFKRKFIHAGIFVTFQTVLRPHEFLTEQTNEFVKKQPYLFPDKISGKNKECIILLDSLR